MWFKCTYLNKIDKDSIRILFINVCLENNVRKRFSARKKKELGGGSKEFPICTRYYIQFIIYI